METLLKIFSVWVVVRHLSPYVDWSVGTCVSSSDLEKRCRDVMAGFSLDRQVFIVQKVEENLKLVPESAAGKKCHDVRHGHGG